MKSSSISVALPSLMEARQPVFIWGGPGIGKSALVRQVAAQAGLPLRDIRALLLDPVDLRGLPFLGSDGRAKWAAPECLPQDGCGILFLDELNAAPAMVQAACYQLVLDRKLGEYSLPDGWAIVAAGNREGDRGATTRMPAPLRNRFVHLDFELDLEEWSRWAVAAGIRPEVIAFLRFRPELLSVFERDAPSPARAPGSSFPGWWDRLRREASNMSSSPERWERERRPSSPPFSRPSASCPTSMPFC